MSTKQAIVVIPNLHDIVSVSPWGCVPRFYPGRWSRLADIEAGSVFRLGPLNVIASLDVLRGNSPPSTVWLHVSVSRSDRLPSWTDLGFVKQCFIGDDREAVQVLPKESDYVNLHKYCLHLWSPEP